MTFIKKLIIFVIIMEDDKLLEEFLKKLITEKGGSRKDYHLLKDKIAWIESKGEADAIQRSSRSRRGPGRGKYQFEMDVSEDKIKGSNRAKDARNRTIRMLNQYGLDTPKWLKDLRLKKTFDASKLTGKQQDLLFFGDLRGNNRVDYKSLSTPEGVKNAWLDTHWVGNRKAKDFKTQRQMKADMWDRHQEKFKPVDYSKLQPTIDGPDKSELKGEYPTVKKDGLVNMLSLAGESDMDYRKRTYSSAPTRQSMSNKLKYGGNSTTTDQSGLNEYATGGTHESNPHGGIPQGIGINGKMNTVEQGETSHKFNGMKYIFSNRLKIK